MNRLVNQYDYGVFFNTSRAGNVEERLILHLHAIYVYIFACLALIIVL